MDLITTTLYHELHKLAAARMARESDPQTLQATALVHEAWLRLGGEHQPDWANRAEFFAAAATAMRRILIDRARYRQALRHGGGLRRVELEALDRECKDPMTTAANDAELLALNEVLEELEQADPATARLVSLRYFAGLSMAELAELVNLPVRTTERRLAFARSWLALAMRADMAEAVGS